VIYPLEEVQGSSEDVTFSPETLSAMLVIAPPGKELKFPENLPFDLSDWGVSPGEVTRTLGHIGLKISATLAVSALLSMEMPAADRRERAKHYAHCTLCDLLNTHAPQLVPVANEVLELPNIPDEGILDSLYFQLRRDLPGQAANRCLPELWYPFPGAQKGCSRLFRRVPHSSSQPKVLEYAQDGQSQSKQ
jgi:hypothetical protein